MPEHHADGLLRLTLGRVAVVEIANPGKRNAITRAMWAALPGIAAAIAADQDARAVILRAEDAAFSAGADIGEFDAVYAPGESAAAYNALVRAAQAAWHGLPRPVIAEIRGPCVGGGCALALACDLRFAGESARLGITPARLGLGFSWEDTALLVATVGPARAKDMLFSGRLLPAAEALAAGLVDRVFPDESLREETEAYAAAVADLSPATHRVTKATVNGLIAAGAAPEAVRELYHESFAGPDFREGRRAFAEKRRPRF